MKIQLMFSFMKIISERTKFVDFYKKNCTTTSIQLSWISLEWFIKDVMSKGRGFFLKKRLEQAVQISWVVFQKKCLKSKNVDFFFLKNVKNLQI